MNISPFKNFCTPANAVSFFENRYFLSHRPPMKFMKISPFKNVCTPANAVSLLENRHFLSHRPPMKFISIYHFHENRVQDSPGLTETHDQNFGNVRPFFLQ